MPDLFTAELKPGRYLGFLILGASLHDVLTRLKAEPQRFPHIQLLYSPSQPITEPVRIALPQNGMRLRFDGPEQRLRLIEILDFAKNHITFNDRDLVRPGEVMGRPTFKHIYNRLFGPTYEGECIPNGGTDTSIYVLSYPGVAFNFDVTADECAAHTGAVNLLAKKEATSMAVFSGSSWAESRPTLWTEVLPSCKVTGQVPKSKDVFPDEVSLARLHGGGRVELQRKWQPTGAFVIQLGETTPQDLVRELGPPSAIYRKNDQRMVIHKMRTASHARDRPSHHTSPRPEDLTDTDHSSMNTGSEDDSDEEAMAVEEGALGTNPTGECFYNYFYLGFDVLLSTPVPPSPAPPGHHHDDRQGASEDHIKNHHPDRLVATKIVLHGNIPGSYEFNRHRRLRWEIAYLPPAADDEDAITSESPFGDIERRMNETWRQHMSDRGRKGMVLNRGWGDSPGSSCELLGGWEDSSGRIEGSSSGTPGDSTTTLYGFPGLVFEVLRSGHVSTVTVF